jgi:hypothetical protein
VNIYGDRKSFLNQDLPSKRNRRLNHEKSRVKYEFHMYIYVVCLILSIIYFTARRSVKYLLNHYLSEMRGINNIYRVTYAYILVNKFAILYFMLFLV